MFSFLSPIGVDAETSSNFGRTDLIYKIKNVIYIFELKHESTAFQALKQCKENCYIDQYVGQYTNIVVIGVDFSDSNRNVDDWGAVVYNSKGVFIKYVNISNSDKQKLKKVIRKQACI